MDIFKKIIQGIWEFSVQTVMLIFLGLFIGSFLTILWSWASGLTTILFVWGSFYMSYMFAKDISEGDLYHPLYVGFIFLWGLTIHWAIFMYLLNTFL
jgi:hypothetical protein